MRFCFYFLLIVSLHACAGREQKKPGAYRLLITQTKLLPAVSSGSGIMLQGKNAWIISDNMNGFFRVDTAGLMHEFFPFVKGAAPVIQEKDIKEDFENACLVKLKGNDHVISFGSGSVDSTREKLLLFPASSPEQVQLLNARPFYRLLKKELKISTAALNLEACFHTSDSIYLLNRGTNQHISMATEGLAGMMNSGFNQLPALSIQSYSLPAMDSFPIAFSGACYFKEDHFLFTASVEKTTNWVADGEVVGSYIGMARLNGPVIFLLPLKDEKGNMIKQKLESVEIIKEDTNRDLHLFAISDNDNGESAWFRIVLLRTQQ